MFTTPQEAEQAFYDALRQADLSLMMRVWADDEEVVCIHPGGMRTIGYDAMQSVWQQIFANGPVTIHPIRPMILTSVMSSLPVLIEHITVTPAQDTDRPSSRDSGCPYGQIPVGSGSI